jgi:hypothetical protein
MNNAQYILLVRHEFVPVIRLDGWLAHINTPGVWTLHQPQRAMRIHGQCLYLITLSSFACLHISHNHSSLT